LLSIFNMRHYSEEHGCVDLEMNADLEVKEMLVGWCCSLNPG